ncbi:MAG: hypothetical protein DRJ52_04460 [Thermoprotei archaeon]|nr:MAG: hypothetical protein DRJ52_04460 [Thermoprotei archaeon]RLF00940.1 MAG: hypothetical protein DRJ63_00840 [Thermoprotei archaeon]
MTPEEVLKLIQERRTARKYSSKPIPEEQLQLLIESAVYAPAGGNKASWKVIIVKDPETKKKLTKVSLNQEFIEEAPVVMVFCGGRVVNVAAAIQNVLLMAHALGLEGCWIGAFNEAEVKKILSVPPNVQVHYIVTIGYPEEELTDPTKRFPEEVVYYETWGQGKVTAQLILKILKQALDKVNEFIKLREKIVAKYGEESLHIYRLEEKYSAFVFASLAKRIIDIAKEAEVEEPEIKLIEKTYRDYAEKRGSALGTTKDINSPQVVSVEREYSTRIFPEVFRKAYRGLLCKLK